RSRNQHDRSRPSCGKRSVKEHQKHRISILWKRGRRKINRCSKSSIGTVADRCKDGIIGCRHLRPFGAYHVWTGRSKTRIYADGRWANQDCTYRKIWVKITVNRIFYRSEPTDSLAWPDGDLSNQTAIQ